MKLSEKIIEYRRENKISQRQLAAKCDLSTGYISLIEKEFNPQTGKRMVPSLPVLNKLANGMGLTIDELFAICDDMPVSMSPNAVVTEENAPAETDERVAEFVSLFGQLTADQQSLIIAQIKGILSAQ